jgi:hypothetical protein
MSLSECERFSADLQSNAALRAEAEKARAGQITWGSAGRHGRACGE